jgi:hypothetical protein
MVSAAADVALRAAADDAGDAPGFELSVWANTRYDGVDNRAGRRLIEHLLMTGTMPKSGSRATGDQNRDPSHGGLIFFADNPNRLTTTRPTCTLWS